MDNNNIGDSRNTIIDGDLRCGLDTEGVVSVHRRAGLTCKDIQKERQGMKGKDKAKKQQKKKPLNRHKHGRREKTFSQEQLEKHKMRGGD